MVASRDQGYRYKVVNTGGDLYVTNSGEGINMSKDYREGMLFTLNEAKKFIETKGYFSAESDELKIIHAKRRHVVSISRCGKRQYIGSGNGGIVVGSLEDALFHKNPLISDGLRKDAAELMASRHREEFDDVLRSTRKEKVYI